MKSQVLALMALVVPLSSQAAEFSVGTGAELQQALSLAGNNKQDDVIHLAPGVYRTSEIAAPYQYSSGDAEKFSLTVEGAGIGQSYLDGESQGRILTIDATGTGNWHDVADQRISVSGISFVNGFYGSENLQLPGGLLAASSAIPVRIQGCSFEANEGNYGGGLRLLSYDNGAEFELLNNRFFSNHARVGGAVDIGGANGELRLEGNLFADNEAVSGGGGAISMDMVNGDASFANNVFHANEASECGGALDIHGGSDDSIAIVNNTVYGNRSELGGGGICVAIDDGSEARLFNNIFWGNESSPDSGQDLFLDDDVDQDLRGPSLDIVANDLGDFLSLCHESSACSSATEIRLSGNFDLDPQFADVAANDFSLQAGSPARDRGDSSAPGLPVLDFEGKTRVQGAAIDVGAIEFAEVPLDPNPEATPGATPPAAAATILNGGGCALQSRPAPAMPAFAWVFLALAAAVSTRSRRC